ncbi:MAG: signal peptidase I [Eubacteriales bacterium]|jgi:signal peptidase I|nr:signal peptidase I [Eubacteriales bacterium]MDD3290505.1 signal peptidase I [Eubacteriales bacterium]MDD3864215.1 signal peptidase I [Eubacteriales bacterium]MDD4445685.1 signal peptidase I [Eubacteriales bacterium]
MGLSENAKEWIKDILVAVVVSIVILQFIKPTIVREHSMENTLKENDYILVSRQAYALFGDPESGDIVVFRSALKTPAGKDKLLVKRIIAVPGDTVAIEDGWVILNGEALEEPYTKDGYTASELEEVTVPEGYLFAMGDNRQNSMDSRDSRVGMIPLEDVLGKAFFRLYPFDHIGGLD